MTFGKKLQRLRSENKLSQEKVAEYTGVSRQAVSKWENDLSYPDTKNLIMLADLFKLSMDELLVLSSNNEKDRQDEKKISNEKSNYNVKDNLFVNIYIVLSPIILFILLKRYIPETVPKHGNIVGIIDTWGNNNQVLYLVLLLSFLMYAFIYKMHKNKKDKVGLLVGIIFIYMYSISQLFTTYQNINYTKNLYDISWTFERQFTFLIACLFLVYGVLAHKIKKNFFAGIKTKWSVSSEEVWKQTHRKSRIYSLLTSGLNFFILLNPAIKDDYRLIISSISIVLLTIFLIVLSYYEYRHSSNKI